MALFLAIVGIAAFGLVIRSALPYLVYRVVDRVT